MPQDAAQARTRTAQSTRWADLLPAAVISPTTAEGKWVRGPAGVGIKSPERWATYYWLQLQPPRDTEYDYEVEFTVADSDGCIAQIIPVGAKHFSCAFSGQAVTIDGSHNAITRPEGGVVVSGRRHIGTVQIRQNAVRVLLDGNVKVEFNDSPRGNFAAWAQWKMTDQRVLGIGAFKTDAVFHAARVAPAAAKAGPPR